MHEVRGAHSEQSTRRFGARRERVDRLHALAVLLPPLLPSCCLRCLGEAHAFSSSVAAPQNASRAAPFPSSPPTSPPIALGHSSAGSRANPSQTLQARVQRHGTHPSWHRTTFSTLSRSLLSPLSARAGTRFASSHRVLSARASTRVCTHIRRRSPSRSHSSVQIVGGQRIARKTTGTRTRSMPSIVAGCGR